ncbi:hypothetical protein SAMN04489723_108125 [Algoriphagus aquimarinus]|uniref:Uncharacterized protein n=1 Tax=Algoriphagus aquimarinus TaxID=237018 RepID=A0A1I1AH04_9BACT|nr:hypothetical protein SAMN04489723_108125 [Algoriphagus aquimarinus]
MNQFSILFTGVWNTNFLYFWSSHALSGVAMPWLWGCRGAVSLATIGAGACTYPCWHSEGSCFRCKFRSDRIEDCSRSGKDHCLTYKKWHHQSTSKVHRLQSCLQYIRLISCQIKKQNIGSSTTSIPFPV